jgi:hypothetical protein
MEMFVLFIKKNFSTIVSMLLRNPCREEIGDTLREVGR